MGSPPHTWRILAPQCIPLSAVRITSTLVENTILIVKKWYLNWDHLHIRGEYEKLFFYSKSKLGSPPHTWRILVAVLYCIEVSRITSTYVENTKTQKVFNRDDEDHLHIRGEYMTSLWKLSSSIGSPPHTWRIQLFVILIPLCVGITSTYVENTDIRNDLIVKVGDHLHIRGEYIKSLS